LGDEFLAPAIQNGLILPLPDDVANAEWYARLPAVWRALACRDASGYPAPPPPPGSYKRGANANSNGSSAAVSASASTAEANNGRYGKLYGVPYRWGCYLIAYRKDKIPRGLRPPTDWPDLFRPQYKKKVGIASGSRFMLTVALRAGGRSANATDVDDATRNRLYDLRTTQLATQVDLDALQGLSNGDVWIIAGNSDDVLKTAAKSSNIGVVVPSSGTTLYADAWCVPAAALDKPGGVSPLVDQWFDFTTQPARTNLRVGLRGGVSTYVFDGDRIDYGKARMDGPTGGFVAMSDRETPPPRAFVEKKNGGVDDDADGVVGALLGRLSGVVEEKMERRRTARENKASGNELMKGGMPMDEVWARSEFLVPLSQRVKDQYNDIIRDWMRNSRVQDS
jgi:hypothetical protein